MNFKSSFPCEISRGKKRGKFQKYNWWIFFLRLHKSNCVYCIYTNFNTMLWVYYFQRGHLKKR